MASLQLRDNIWQIRAYVRGVPTQRSTKIKDDGARENGKPVPPEAAKRALLEFEIGCSASEREELLDLVHRLRLGLEELERFVQKR